MGKSLGKNCIILALIALLLLPADVRAEGLALRSGDRLVIATQDFSMALSAEPNGAGLRGVEFLPDRIETATVWTALQQSDGSWIFETDGGRLSIDPEGNTLTLNGPYDSWVLVESGDGSVHLSNSQTQGVLTWNPDFDTFGLGESESEASRLGLRILPAEEPDAPDPVPEPPKTEIGGWKFYFGQLHSHTADSDGAGTVADAYSRAAGTPDVDFYAVTDHSDSFDNDLQGSLAVEGGSVSQIWAAGKAAAKAATNENFVALYGFEMSWEQGQGHMTTFNTPGFLSRDQDAYQMYKDGLENYLDALLSLPGSVSQFNHPNLAQGNFKAFDIYAPELDRVISLLEIGCGEGSEYKTYFDAYVQALDKGWHLAPTTGLNDHSGSFGNISTTRTVILAKDLTEQSLYEAMKARRVYATEDTDFQIYYSLGGAVMGSVLRRAQVGDQVELVLKMYDPTDQDLGKVELIGPGGEVLSSVYASSNMTAILPADAAYYFLRITQGDGDVAVTAPVWIRQSDDVGISAFKTRTELTRAGEEQTLMLTVYNREGETLQITGITVTDGDGNEVATAEASIVEGYSTKTYSFDCIFNVDGVQNLTALVRVEFPEGEKEFTQTLQIPVIPMAMTSDVLVDGTHGQKQTFDEWISMAAAKNISLRIETEAISPKQLESCSLLVIPAPEEPFGMDFLEMIKNYVNCGGKLLLLGKAGGSEELNRLLETVGSGLRLHGDTARDPVSNGGTAEQIYTAQVGNSPWTEGIMPGQIYAHIDGCTVNAVNGLIKSNTGDILLAGEDGILLAGSNFLEDIHLKTEDNPWALPYANRTIAENLLGISQTPGPLAPIAAVRQAERNRIYLVEGRITAGTHNINTVFPDSIYIQDESGAIEVRGVSEPELERGTPARIYGILETENGRPILRAVSTAMGQPETPLDPEILNAMPDYAQKGDQLIKIQGTVTHVEFQGDVVRAFTLKDSAGAETVVWVEEYILSGSLGRNHLSHMVREDYKISAVGFCHLRNGRTVLRVRDCDEVELLWAPAYPDSPATGDETDPGRLLLAMALSGLLFALCITEKKKDRS